MRTRYNWGKEDRKGTVTEMAVWKKLPMGIEQFEEIRRDGYYYVDKSLFMAEGQCRVKTAYRPLSPYSKI